MGKLKPKRRYVLTVETFEDDRADQIDHVLQLAAEKLDGRLTMVRLIPDGKGSHHLPKHRKVLRRGNKNGD